MRGLGVGSPLDYPHCLPMRPLCLSGEQGQARCVEEIGRMPLDSIIVRGAREHNLKNIDIVIPRDRLVVITGLSGSGKTSLPFDTIFPPAQPPHVTSPP